VSYPRIECAADWEHLAESIASSGADVVVLNTFQRDSVAQWADRLGLPVVGIVHNPMMFLEQETCVRMATTGQAAILTLAPHVSEWLKANAGGAFSDVGCVSHTFWDMPRTARSSGTRRLVIPGAVNYASRDYRSVLAAMPDIVRSAESVAVEFVIAGGGPDRAAFQEAVLASPYSSSFRFAVCSEETGYVDNQTYFAHLAEADFILPMLPESRADFRVFKITSAISTSVGFVIPAIVDRWTASVYGLPCVQYERGGMLDGLLAAVSMEEAELEQLRDKLADFRMAERDRSARALAKGVDAATRGRRDRKPA
jgi:hypothetical protein